MTKWSRPRGGSGVNHVLLRMDTDWFTLEETEKSIFLQALEKSRSLSGFELCAYALFEDHIHLVLWTGAESLETVMRRIINRFTARVRSPGEKRGVFYRRYQSEPVDSSAFLLSTVRHIHREPVALGLCGEPGEYPYSSFRAYEKGPGEPPLQVDAELVLDALHREALEEPILGGAPPEPPKKCLELKPPGASLDGEGVRALLVSLCGCASPKEFALLPQEAQTAWIGELKRRGVPVRKITAATGATQYRVFSTKVEG